MQKQCNRCGETKPLSEFGAYRRAKDGLKPRCKSCVASYNKDNAEAIRERMSDYRKSNAEAISNSRALRRLSISSRARALYIGAKHRADDKSIAFEMSIHRIEVALMIGNCERTGIPFDLSPHDKYHINPFAPSVDKIDPFGGYTDTNTKIVVDAYNRGKQQMTHDEFLEFCKRFVAFNNPVNV